MNRLIKAAFAGMGVVALTGAGLVGMAGTASAATTGNFGVNIAYQPDANDLGGVYFYDAAGHQITSGSTTSVPLAAYYVTSAASTSAFAADSTPQTGNSATWTSTQGITSTQTEPRTGLPGDLTGFSGTVVADDSAASFQDIQIANFPQTSSGNPGYDNLYEVRIYTGTATGTWYAAEIQIDAPGHWRQVFPNQVTPTVAVSSTTTNPSTTGSPVALRATLGTALPGKVQFFDGTTAIGTPQTVSGTQATFSDPSPTAGTHHYNATFIPTPGSNGLGASNTAPYDQVVSAPAISTSIAFVSQTVGTTANDPASVTFQISAGDSTHPAGVVTIKDGPTTLGSATESPAGSGTYFYSTTALGQGSHQFVGSFAPTSSAYSAPSATASGQAFSYAGSPTVGQPDPQNIDTVVPAGIVTITTPYNGSSVFHLGTLGLDSTASYLVGSALFPAAADNPITVTDTRAGGLPWHATVTSGDLSGPSSAKINGQNLGLEGVSVSYDSGNALNGKVTVHDTVSANGVAPGDPGSAGLKGGPTFASTTTNSGVGTAYFRGALTMKAPTSTPSGTYTGTITFTVIGS